MKKTRKTRKVARPKKVPTRITISFDLLGKSEEERLSQYMWLKAHARQGTLPVVMQTLFECETAFQTAEQVCQMVGDLITPEDIPAIKYED